MATPLNFMCGMMSFQLLVPIRCVSRTGKMNDKNPFEFKEPDPFEQQRKPRRKKPLWVKVANGVVVFLLSTPFIWMMIRVLRNLMRFFQGGH